MLQDTQHRLVYRAQAFIRSEIQNFKPTPNILDYPARLKGTNYLDLTVLESKMAESLILFSTILTRDSNYHLQLHHHFHQARKHLRELDLHNTPNEAQMWRALPSLYQRCPHQPHPWQEALPADTFHRLPFSSLMSRQRCIKDGIQLYKGHFGC